MFTLTSMKPPQVNLVKRVCDVNFETINNSSRRTQVLAHELAMSLVYICETYIVMNMARRKHLNKIIWITYGGAFNYRALWFRHNNRFFNKNLALNVVRKHAHNHLCSMHLKKPFVVS